MPTDPTIAEEESLSTQLPVQLAALFAVDVALLSGAERNRHMGRLQRVRTQVEAASLAMLATFDDLGSWSLDSSHGTANWLATHTGTSRSDAGRRVRLARELRSMPITAASLAEGAITEAHAMVLARCVSNRRVSPAFSAAEADLVAHAETVPADALANVVATWVQLTDQDGPAPRDPTRDTVSATRVGDRVKLNGDLGLEVGVPLLAALEERMQILFRRDVACDEANPADPLGRRSIANRRAEALTELVMAGAGAESNPRRRQPLFNVHVDAELLATRTLTMDSVHELDDGTVVPLSVLDAWSCGALYARIMHSASGAVLDVGQTERYATPGQQRALAARDHGCAVPGCGRPPAHCDAHHVWFWEHGGPTAVENMMYLCRHHHRMVHAGAIEALMIDGMPHFVDRDGVDIATGRHRPIPSAA